MFPVVDVSDTSMAASGTTKKISVNNILGASGTATLASASITGAATVGTTLGVTGVSTLTGAVGVGAAPLGKFDVYNTASDTNIFIRSDTTRLGQIVFRDNADAANQGIVRYDHLNDRLSFTANGAENLYLLSTGDLSVTTGNVVMGTSGKGIDFSATASGSGTMTSELLNDYEEGTWTPSFQNVTLGNGSVTGFYTKIGNIVSVMFKLTFGSTTSVTSSVLTISGLPFSIDTIAVGYVNLLRSGVGQYLGVVTRNSATVFDFRALTVSGSTVLSSTLNATAPATWGTSDEFTSQVTYRAS
jgi:hypothetical protein